jgi:hypothetical protein
VQIPQSCAAGQLTHLAVSTWFEIVLQSTTQVAEARPFPVGPAGFPRQSCDHSSTN